MVESITANQADQQKSLNQHKLDVEAAAAVNDDGLINTPIEKSEAAQIQNTRSDSAVDSQGGSSGLKAANSGSRELIWKTAEGAEKRLLLPFEMIKEDVMDDPERLLENVSPDEADDEERAKILSALHEMQGNMRKESKKNATATGNNMGHDSAVSMDKSANQNDDDEDGQQADDDIKEDSQEDEGEDTMQANPSIEADFQSQKLSGLAAKSQQTAKGAGRGTGADRKNKARFGSQASKGKKGAMKVRRGQSEMISNPKSLNPADGNIAEEEANDEDGEEDAPEVVIDTRDQFEKLKAKFFEQETHLNDEDQLRELQDKEEQKLIEEAKERERKEKEEEEKLKQEAEEEFAAKVYGPGGRFGKTPNIAAVQQVLHKQAEARRLKRQKEREERKEKLRQERLARGEAVNEEDLAVEEEESEEEIDYNVEMQEEETVPDGQKQQMEEERMLAGKQMRQIVRNPGKLVKMNAESTLPKKLPENLVYWNRCETRVDSQKLVTYSQIKHFQQANLIQFRDDESKEKVMKKFPMIDGLEMWADPSQEKFVNQHEKAIYGIKKWPKSQKEYIAEGLIKFERIRTHDVFFNSRFESGNLRQVYKVPQEIDFDYIPKDDIVPDYIPEELQELRREEIIEERKAFMAKLQKKHIEEETEDAEELKTDLKLRKGKKKEANVLDDDDKKDENHDLEVVASDNEDKKDDGEDGEDNEEGKSAAPGRKRKGKKVQKEEVKVSCEYNLYLQDDTNADSALFQWYYFSCMNIKADTVVRINICNLSKPNGLYAKGMKPFVYSLNKQKTSDIGWHRGCENVKYYQNGHTARYTKKTLDAHFIADGTVPVGSPNLKQLHSLQFDYRFESDHDVVFFAHFQPYTYTDLINFLCTLKANDANSDKMRMDYICNTLGKAPMYGLTITNNIKTHYVQSGKEIFKFQRYEYKGTTVKPKKVKYEKVEQPGTLGLSNDSDSSSSSSSIQSISVRVEDEKPNGDQGEPKSELAPSRIEKPAGELGVISQMALGGQSSPDVVAAIANQMEPLSATLNPTQHIEVKKLGDANDESEIQSPVVAGSGDISNLQMRQSERSNEMRDSQKNEAKSPTSRKGKKKMLKPSRKQSKSQLVSGNDVSHQSDAAKTKSKRGDHQTSLTRPDNIEEKIEKIYKKTIFITSRVHPGESQASHMVHGLIEFLLSDDPEAEEVREKFVVKIIPMLNPDGVIHGNYRVGLLGVDLNRRWKKPSKYLHPTIYYTKQLIKYFNIKHKQPGCESGGVLMCCDFHGHSRNMDLFMYSCIGEVSMNNMIIRSIPVGVDKYIPMFNMKLCNFAMEKDKQNTARIVIYKELGILSSYTLESTFYGSDFLKRPKQGSLLTKEQLEYQSARYDVGYQRKDISINFDACVKMGADFIRGINFASKKRPLLEYWFRSPPKNIIEIIRRFPGQNGDEDIDPVLLELEKNWKPLGHVDQNKFLGIGDRFEEGTVPELPPTPPEQKKAKARKVDKLDVALIDKMKKQKKQRAKERKQAQVDKKREENKLNPHEKDKDLPLNNDMLDVFDDDTNPIKASKKGKKGKGVRGRSPPQKRSRSRTKQEAIVVRSSGRDPTRNQLSGKSLHASIGNLQNQSASIEAIDDLHEKDARKVPILLREPGQTFHDDEESDEIDKEELRVSQLIFSNSKGLVLSQELKQSQLENANAANRASSSEDEENNEYLISKALDSVTKSTNKHMIESMNQTGDGFNRNVKNDYDTSSKGSGSRKRQLNLSVRVKEGKAMFKAAQGGKNDVNNVQTMPRIESQLEDGPELTDERIESRLISDNRRSGNQYYQQDGSMMQKSSYLRAGGEEELRAMDELQETADITKQQEQMLLNQLELTKKNIASSQQVSADELDDLMKTDQDGIIMQRGSPQRNQIYAHVASDATITSGTFKKNRLSVDPQVYPSSKFEALAQVQMKTLEKEMTYQSQYKTVNSPRKSKAAIKNSPGRGIFAPQNAVYNQTQLLQNPALAKAQGINFYIQPPEQICINKNQHHDMLILKQQLGMNASMKQQHTATRKIIEHNSMTPSMSIKHMQHRPSHQTEKKQSVISPPQFEKKGSNIFQTKLSTAGLLNHSLTHNSSLNTIQTAVGPPGSGVNFDQGFSINDYVNEQISLLEKTKVQVAAKKSKKAKQNKKLVQNLHNSPPSGIILPNIQTNGSARVVRESNSTKKVNSLIDLGSVGHHLTTEGLSQVTSKEKVTLQAADSITHLDGQNIEFPALSPRAIKAPSPQRKCIEMKNGFDFANNVSDRHNEKLIDLKQTQTLRQRQRRMSKPQFVIKPLDPREFLNIQMQHVENGDYINGQVSPKHQGKVRRGGSLNHARPSKEAIQHPTSLIKVLDSMPMSTPNPGSPGISPENLLPSPQRASRRTMSMGNQINKQYSPTQGYSSLPHHPNVTLAVQQSPPPQLAKATLRKEIKQREVKSLAVRNMVNQTMVVNNKLLVFKPNP